MALPLSAQATTYYVRAAGNDRADGLTAATAFKSILRAAQVLNHGDNIVIGPGAYRETVLFAERFAADGATMSITGDESGKLTGDAAGPIVITPRKPTDIALEFVRVNRLHLSGLTLRGPGQGIKLERCNQVLIDRSTFDGLTRGLIGSSTKGLRVEASVFTRCAIGLFVQQCVDTRIAHVSIAGSYSSGLLALSCGEGEICNSILAANNTNLIVDRLSAAAWTSDHNVLSGSTGGWGDVPTIAKPYEWFAASGQDRHSVHVVPEFVNVDQYDLHIAPAVSWAGGLPGRGVGRVLNPPVEQDRDGKPFVAQHSSLSAGAYQYPEPQPANGWQKTGQSIAAGGPRSSAGVYREDGTLVRTLLADAAGVSEIWWDGRDDLGQPVPAGKYELKSIAHDVRIVDDGAIGDDGNPLGAYNCDNADRVVPLEDGGFIITTVYDEAGYPLRRYSASGQPIFASNLKDKDFAALAITDDELFGVVGAGASSQLVRLVLPGERALMATGAESYAICAAGEANAKVTGLAVVAGRAYIGLEGLNVVRVIDLKTGAKQADWPLPEVGDLGADADGKLYAISGQNVVTLTDLGKVRQQFATNLAAPRYLAVGASLLAVVDRANAQVSILNRADVKVQRVLGNQRPSGQWAKVEANLYRDPRGATFLTDGRLVITEQARVRIIWPESGAIQQDLLSNFMDVAVVHPLKPEYVYCALGAFHVDPQSGAWRWLVEEPRGQTPPDKDGKSESLGLGSPSTTVVLGGRPFIAYFNTGRLRLVDVSDPLAPRLAFDERNQPQTLSAWAYATIGFSQNGDLVTGGHYNLQFAIVPFTGLDAQGNPSFDFAHPKQVGYEKDTDPRDMKAIAALAPDPVSNDIYYLAVTALNNKMVPGWGADGTGVGKSSASGAPQWFAPSSGGNYMSISMVHDEQAAWILAGKSFGGQIDLFDADGLRLTTGNWTAPTNFQIGFVDLRYGVHAYRRPDGKIGAYVEDDAIGRFARCRVDGAESLKRLSTAIEWKQPTATASAVPDAHAVGGKSLEKVLVVPKVASLPTDGDWTAWEKAGVVPQIIALPAVGFKRSVPDDLWQSFRTGTGMGAIAHDSKNLYVYFVVTDDTPHFDSEGPGTMWMFDGVELWLEEEQIGLGMTKDGTPQAFKYRHHSIDGKPFNANYGLPRDYVWAAQIPDLARHPLGAQLATITGVSFEGKPGYGVMAKIPMQHVKLTGGIAGRDGQKILDMTGQPGEVLRIGVAFGGISAFGREQDFKVNWPSTLMFSDPTRSTPFVLGE